MKQHCLMLYVNGLGFRAIERVTGVDHTTVIYWVKQLGTQLADVPEASEIPQVGELDERFWEELFPPKLSHELETFVGAKKTRSGRQ